MNKSDRLSNNDKKKFSSLSNKHYALKDEFLDVLADKKELKPSDPSVNELNKRIQAFVNELSGYSDEFYLAHDYKFSWNSILTSYFK